MKKTTRIIAPHKHRISVKKTEFFEESPKFWKDVSNGIEQQVRASGAVLTEIDVDGIYVISKTGNRTLLAKGNFKSSKIQRRKFVI
jgi:hypothetical protein